VGVSVSHRVFHPCFFPYTRRRPPRSPLFPYTTLFRSLLKSAGAAAGVAAMSGLSFGKPARAATQMSYMCWEGYNDPRIIDPFNKDRKSTRLNSSHVKISYAVFCLKKKKNHVVN